MGETVTRKPDQAPATDSRGTEPRTPAEPRTGTQPGTAGPDRTHRNPPAPAPGTGTPAPARADAGPRTQTRKEEKPVQVPVLKEAAPVPAEPQKKKKRTPKKKKEEPQNFNADQISTLILTASGIVASRPDMGIWQLQQEEAMQLAQPIANMIEKSEVMQKMGEHTDAVALVTAALVIFTPRVIAQAAVSKEKKKTKNGGVVLVDTRKSEKGKSKGSNDRLSESPAPVNPGNLPPIYESIPEPF